MSRLPRSFVVLFAMLLLVPSAAGEDGASVLKRLAGLISVLDLPSGFREVRRHGSPRYPDASLRYEGTGGEIITALARVTDAASEQAWLRESTKALRARRRTVKMLGLGDGAYLHRTTTTSAAAAVKGPWRLTIRVEKGQRPAAEANRLAEQLLRKMYARFGGQQPVRTEVPEMGPFENNQPPRITRLWYSPANPTYDDVLKVSLQFNDPERRAVTVHWWYPDGATRQRQKFSVPAGAGTHTFALPKKPDRRSLEFLVFVEDDAGHKVNQTLQVPVEAPFARVTAATGLVVPERRIARLATVRTMNLYAGDVLHFGSGHRRGLGRSTTDLEWPEANVRGRYIFDPIAHGSQSTWSKITIGPPPLEEGVMASVQFLFSYVVGEGISKGTKFVLRGDRFQVGGAIGAFEYMMGSAGGSGVVYVKLKSLVVLQSDEAGSLGFYTYEGSPELISPSGERVVVRAAHRTRIRSTNRIERPTRFDPKNAPKLPPAARATQAPPVNVSVKQIDIQHGVVRADGRGLLVKAHLRIQGRRGLPTQVYAFVGDRNATPLKDTDGRYANDAGHVCSVLTVTPRFDDTTWSPPLELFLPYEELHLTAGRHELLVHVEVFDKEAGRDLLRTPKQILRVLGGGAIGAARLLNPRIAENLVREGHKGQDILFELEVSRRVGRKTIVAVYVQYQNGDPLLDQDGQFSDSQGNVATHIEVVPEHESAHWAHPRIFIPYTQLHLQPGVHKLRLFLQVLDPSTGTPLARSGWLNFQVTRR